MFTLDLNLPQKGLYQNKVRWYPGLARYEQGVCTSTLAIKIACKLQLTPTGPEKKTWLLINNIWNMFWSCRQRTHLRNIVKPMALASRLPRRASCGLFAGGGGPWSLEQIPRMFVYHWPHPNSSTKLSPAPSSIIAD